MQNQEPGKDGRELLPSNTLVFIIYGEIKIDGKVVQTDILEAVRTGTTAGIVINNAHDREKDVYSYKGNFYQFMNFHQMMVKG